VVYIALFQCTNKIHNVVSLMSAMCSSWMFSSFIRHVHMMVFQDMMSFSLVGKYQYFEGNYSLHYLSWRWRKLVPPKNCYSSTSIHSATFQKSAILIFTTVWTSHLKGYVLCNGQNHVYKNWVTSERSKHPTDLSHWSLLFVCWVTAYRRNLDCFIWASFYRFQGHIQQV
jgi:hypothetical protein